MQLVAVSSTPVAISLQEIENECLNDVKLREARKCVISGNWSQNKFTSRYVQVKNELCTSGGSLLRGNRLVIPYNLHKRVIDLTHEDHQGIVKTKSQLRTKVWGPTIDKDAENKCRTCHGCQVVADVGCLQLISSVKLKKG